jgi:hypothetical protein
MSTRHRISFGQKRLTPLATPSTDFTFTKSSRKHQDMAQEEEDEDQDDEPPQEEDIDQGGDEDDQDKEDDQEIRDQRPPHPRVVTPGFRSTKTRART